MNASSTTTPATASPDVATPSVLAVPLRECAPWCTEGDGHQNAHPEDRYCRTDSKVVPLSLGEAYKSDGAWFLPGVDLYMTREYDEDEPRFTLVHEELAPAGIQFTENELRQLLGSGLMLLDKAEAARS